MVALQLTEAEYDTLQRKLDGEFDEQSTDKLHLQSIILKMRMGKSIVYNVYKSRPTGLLTKNDNYYDLEREFMI